MKKSLIRSSLCVALLCCMSTTASAYWPFGKKKASASKKKKTTIVPIFRLSGNFPDRKPEFSFLQKEETPFPRLLRRIRMVGFDTRVQSAVFLFRGLALGRVKAEELRRTIAGLRKKGKQTFAVLEGASTPDYIAALGCKRIIMAPSGMLFMPGMRIEQLYFKKVMDKLGIVGDFVTMGDFKTAPEPFLRESMSPAQQKQLGSLLDSLYKQHIQTMVKARKISAAQAKKVIDRALWTPAAAKKAKPVDELSYFHVLKQQIVKSHKGMRVKFVEKYGKKKKAKPQSLWSLFSMFLRAKKKKVTSKRPKIAIIYAQGEIQYGSSPGSFGGDDGIWSSNMLKVIDEVSKLKNLRAVVLRVDSPGGSALASDLIWRRLEKLKKRVPLYVSMGNVAASGGYYIAMGADVLFAHPSTITGSIGVFAGKMVLRGTMDKIGVNVQTVARGKQSGIFSPFSRFSATERQTIKSMISETYADFLAKGAKGRKMKLAKLKNLAGGRVWTGVQAKSNGLVDKLGSLQDAVNLAVKRTGLKKRPEILVYPRTKGFFEALQSMSGAHMRQTQLWQPTPAMIFPQLPAASIKILPAVVRPMFRSTDPRHSLLMWSSVPHVRY